MAEIASNCALSPRSEATSIAISRLNEISTQFPQELLRLVTIDRDGTQFDEGSPTPLDRARCLHPAKGIPRLVAAAWHL